MDNNLARETLNSNVTGYHAYMDTWIPLVEELDCEHKCGNGHDENAIPVLHDNMINRRVVGHFPNYTQRVIWQISLISWA